jgi:hypothetical protein
MDFAPRPIFQMQKPASSQDVVNDDILHNVSLDHDLGETVRKARLKDENAQQRLIKQADNGYAPAQWEVGKCYKEGIGGLFQHNNKLAFHYFSLAADQEGGAEAQTECGIMCKKGIGCAQNSKKGWEYLCSASELGHPLAQFLSAWEVIVTCFKELDEDGESIKFNGLGDFRFRPPEDSVMITKLQKQYKNVKLLADKCPPAKFVVRCIDGYERNPDLTITPLFLEGVFEDLMEYAPVQFMLGQTTDDPDKALLYLEAAASQGYGPAQYGAWKLLDKLGRKEEAASYRTMAIDQGHPLALSEESLTELSPNIINFLKDELGTGKTRLADVPRDLVPTIFKYLYVRRGDFLWSEPLDWTYLHNFFSTVASYQAIPTDWIDDVIMLVNSDNHGFKPDQTY